MAKRAKTAVLEIPDEEFNRPKRVTKKEERVLNINAADGAKLFERVVAKFVDSDSVGDNLGVRDEPEIDESAPLNLKQDFSFFDGEDPDWIQSDEVREIARELIEKHYQWIDEEEIYIRYVLSDKMVKKSGTPCLGKMTVVSAFNARLADRSEKFFCMIISRSSWERMGRRHKVALVDHELAHCDYSRSEKDGKVKIKLRGHDLEEFVAVYRRHGAWASDVQEFLSVVPEKPMPLFDHAGET